MLRLENISKSFPGVQALDGVTLEFHPGEVHAVCGENGAGKSTLMNIICGNQQPDDGRIIWKGHPVHIENIYQANQMGISMVYQERSLVDSLSIAENIFPVNQPTRYGLIDHKELNRRARKLLAELELSGLSPGRNVGSLSPAQKSLVEIAKALAVRPALLILDEPTASLTNEQTDTLFRLIDQLKKQGMGIIYISHRMAEIREIADKVTVLKDGRYQGTFPGHTHSEEIIRHMVGRELMTVKYGSDATNDTLLQVNKLSGYGFSNVSFDLHRGEILGLGGLEGSGRTELCRTLFGEMEGLGGQITLNGKDYLPQHPSTAIRSKVAYLPEDRKREGLFLDNSVLENIASVHLDTFWYRKGELSGMTGRLLDDLDIRATGIRQKVQKLSGGNQQKVVLARWLSRDPDLLIVNEPTHGVDVGAKAAIYEILKSLTAQGKSILLVSSELPELMLLSDRIAVMYKGRLVGILNKEIATEEKIISIASGI